MSLLQSMWLGSRHFFIATYIVELCFAAGLLDADWWLLSDRVLEQLITAWSGRPEIFLLLAALMVAMDMVTVLKGWGYQPEKLRLICTVCGCICLVETFMFGVLANHALIAFWALRSCLPSDAQQSGCAASG
ncbi:hypothetical protein [Oceanobacter mangrovi]|uniref:hypothetical protein n=1 Tax=Oceanobacter mangrovi TaxID=2862510 RepID=UPI001C8D407D|nr:hypothetical protein [Oceanobacter mangrovi]